MPGLMSHHLPPSAATQQQQQHVWQALSTRAALRRTGRRIPLLAAALRPRRASGQGAAADGGGSGSGSGGRQHSSSASRSFGASNPSDSSRSSSVCSHTGCATRSQRSSKRVVVGRSHSSSSASTRSSSRSASEAGTQPQASSLDVPHDQLPRHLAVIMDGNSRWARARGLPAAFGYTQGVVALRTLVRCCQHWGVPCLTVYGFSAENWRRPPAEVDFLLSLVERVLASEVAELAARGVRLRFIGELGMLPRSLQRQISSAELATGDNCDLHLTIALSYSGRQDVTLAVQEIARLAASGQLRPADVNPALIERHLATRQLPPAWQQPDLVIRTSGEQRLSNFLLWESAYSELYFSDLMWPDFGERQLAEALRDYAGRERRYGGRQDGGSGNCGGGPP